MKNKFIKSAKLVLILLTLASALFSCDNSATEHTHDFQMKYSKDSHYLSCSCGDTKDSDVHTLDWVIDTEPTYSAPGYQHKECSTCGYKTEENTVIERLLHEEILSSGRVDLSAYSQESFKTTFGLGNFLYENRNKIDGSCLSLDISKLLYRQFSYSSLQDEPVYIFGYNEKDGMYGDCYLKTLYRISSEELDPDGDREPHPSLPICFVSYGLHKEIGIYSFDFYRYNDTESIWNYLVKIFESNACVAEMYYYAAFDIDREWIASVLNEAIDKYSQNIYRDTRENLNRAFDTIKADATQSNKINLGVEGEELHYELKETGLYDDSDWEPSGFSVYLKCNYEDAVDEEWYKHCTETSRKALNEAFYNYYKSEFPNGEFSNLLIMDGLYFGYSTVDDFLYDYPALKALSELDYITDLEIYYYFGLPYDYMLEL